MGQCITHLLSLAAGVLLCFIYLGRRAFIFGSVPLSFIFDGVPVQHGNFEIRVIGNWGGGQCNAHLLSLAAGQCNAHLFIFGGRPVQRASFYLWRRASATRKI